MSDKDTMLTCLKYFWSYLHPISFSAKGIDIKSAYIEDACIGGTCTRNIYIRKACTRGIYISSSCIGNVYINGTYIGVVYVRVSCIGDRNLLSWDSCIWDFTNNPCKFAVLYSRFDIPGSYSLCLQVILDKIL